MPEILLTPEMLRDEASNLDNKRNTLTEAVNKIKTLVDSLQSGWHGKAQAAFVDSFLGKKAEYDKFATDIEAFSAFMRQYASAMEQQDSSATSGLNF